MIIRDDSANIKIASAVEASHLIQYPGIKQATKDTIFRIN